jgi:hypothetical protein
MPQINMPPRCQGIPRLRSLEHPLALATEDNALWSVVSRWAVMHAEGVTRGAQECPTSRPLDQSEQAEAKRLSHGELAYPASYAMHSLLPKTVRVVMQPQVGHHQTSQLRGESKLH